MEQVKDLNHLQNIHKQNSQYRGGGEVAVSTPKDEALCANYINLMQKWFEKYCKSMGSLIACPPPSSNTSDFFSSLEQKDGNDEKNVSDYINNWNKRGVFMRLSARSPKDYGPHMLVASMSGKDIFDRVVKSSRSRCSLSEHIESKDPAKSTHIILMPWMDDLMDSCEFRCFIHNKSLNAISQYDCYHPSPLLADVEMAVYFRDYIDYFHEQIKDRIPYSSYVMDVVIAPNPINPLSSSSRSNDNKNQWFCNLIEFNPFFADGSSGASCFDWKSDYDIIMKTRSPPLIRIRAPKTSGSKSKNRYLKQTEVLDIWG